MVLKEKITVAITNTDFRFLIYRLTVYTPKNIFKKITFFLGMVNCRSALVLPCPYSTLEWNPQMETCQHTKNFNSKLKISAS